MKTETNVAEMKPKLEGSYLALIQADQEQNKQRATNLPILDEAAKKNIVDACKFSSYFPNPITKDFMRKYILSKVDFPTKESCLAQSITELNVRIDNLFNDAYMHSKAELEVEECELKIEECSEKLAKAESEIEKKQITLEIKKQNLELTNKKHSLNKIQLAAMARYKEAMGWKACAEEFLEECGKKSLDEVDWDNIRMGEMQGKIKLWGELQAKGIFENSPSKLMAILSNEEAFAEGIQKGSAEIQALHAEQQRLNSKAAPMLARPPHAN